MRQRQGGGPRSEGAAITEELFGRKVLALQHLNFPIGTQQPAHFDTMAFQSDPPNYMCGVWVALEDMDMDNGPLIYYPGSYKLRPTWEEIDELTGTRIDRSATRPSNPSERPGTTSTRRTASSWSSITDLSPSMA